MAGACSELSGFLRRFSDQGERRLNGLEAQESKNQEPFWPCLWVCVSAAVCSVSFQTVVFLPSFLLLYVPLEYTGTCIPVGFADAVFKGRERPLPAKSRYKGWLSQRQMQTTLGVDMLWRTRAKMSTSVFFLQKEHPISYLIHPPGPKEAILRVCGDQEYSTSVETNASYLFELNCPLLLLFRNN